MHLLRECTDQVEVLKEGEGDKQNLYLSGIFMQSNLANKNKRIYPTTVMEREVRRYVTDVMKHGSSIGELSHPQTPSINLDRVSHKITDLKMEGSNVTGKALVLNTPMGQIARGLLEGGVRLGVSSRGVGTLKPIHDGLMEVGPDFKLVTVDIVSDPSAPEAWVNAVMENVSWVWDAVKGDWRREEALAEQRQEMRRLTPRQLEETRLRALENYLKLIG